MPSLVIDDRGTEIFYVDSGRPQKDVYTTVVMVHGHTFHSGFFRRLLPLAASRGIRLICPNRRDYAGTTLYSPSELNVLATGSEAKKAAFLESRGIEVALFLNCLIGKYSLPPPTADGDNGGLALVGWSLGVIEPLATVASVSSFPAEVRTRLQLYLRRLVLYDPPSLALGIKDPPKHYFPLFDVSIPQDERGVSFARWVSSHFAHGDVSSRDLDNLSYKFPDPSRIPSIANIPSHDLGAIVDTSPAERSEAYLITRFEVLLGQQTIKALFDPTTRATWSRLDVWLLHGDSSPWMMLYSAWEVEKKAKATKQFVGISSIKNAHHFVLWDEPEKALDALLHCL